MHADSLQVKIGLETHCQLNTNTKLFCGCSIKNISKAPPNSRTCPICLGHPGSKPVVNKAAIDAGIKIALALGCDVPEKMYFSRKIYFYPDMSKNFQITQYELPFAKNGMLEILDEAGKRKAIIIERINLEEDPAKIQHEGGSIVDAAYTLVDYNRAGTPLCEIVTAPQFSTPKEARIFLQLLSSILEYLGVFISGELSLKTDVNISVAGGPRVEIKNVTGFWDVEKALAHELFRQKALLERGERIERETRAWLHETKTTVPLRKKELEEDYGYIFEPDLPSLEIGKEWIDKIRQQIPELPHQKFKRYISQFKLSPELASAITAELELALFYEQIIHEIDPRFAASWMNVLKKTLYYNKVRLKDTMLTARLFVKLLKVIQKREVSDRAGEMVLREIIFSPEKFDRLVEQYSRLEHIDDIVDKVIKQEKDAVENYKKGDKKAIHFLIGQVIKASGRRIDAKEAKKTIQKLIGKHGCV